MKYNVKLLFCKHLGDIEADSEDEAIRKAKIEATKDDFNYFITEDYVASILTDRFEENHSAWEDNFCY